MCSGDVEPNFCEAGKTRHRTAYVLTHPTPAFRANNGKYQEEKAKLASGLVGYLAAASPSIPVSNHSILFSLVNLESMEFQLAGQVRIYSNFLLFPLPIYSLSLAIIQDSEYIRRAPVSEVNSRLCVPAKPDMDEHSWTKFCIK